MIIIFHSQTGGAAANYADVSQKQAMFLSPDPHADECTAAAAAHTVTPEMHRTATASA